MVEIEGFDGIISARVAFFRLELARMSTDGLKRKCLFLNLCLVFCSELRFSLLFGEWKGSQRSHRHSSSSVSLWRQFDFIDDDLKYVGGEVHMPYLDRDKVSVLELRGFLADHVNLKKTRFSFTGCSQDQI